MILDHLADPPGCEKRRSKKAKHCDSKQNSIQDQVWWNVIVANQSQCGIVPQHSPKNGKWQNMEARHGKKHLPILDRIHHAQAQIFNKFWKDGKSQ